MRGVGEDLRNSIFSFEFGGCRGGFFGLRDGSGVAFAPGDGFGVCGFVEESFIVGVGELEEPVEDPACCS